VSRTDYLPSAADRAALAGDSATTTSPRYELAASVRRLNRRLAELDPEQAAALLSDWHASWAKLQRERDLADDGTQFALVAAWESHWQRRLDEG